MQDFGAGPCAQPNSKSIVCVLVAGLISGPVKWSVYDEWCLRVLKRWRWTTAWPCSLSLSRLVENQKGVKFTPRGSGGSAHIPRVNITSDLCFVSVYIFPDSSARVAQQCSSSQSFCRKILRELDLQILKKIILKTKQNNNKEHTAV